MTQTELRSTKKLLNKPLQNQQLLKRRIEISQHISETEVMHSDAKFFRLETESRVQRQVGILIATVESYPIKAGEICFRSSNWPAQMIFKSNLNFAFRVSTIIKSKWLAQCFLHFSSRCSFQHFLPHSSFAQQVSGNCILKFSNLVMFHFHLGKICKKEKK